MIYLSLLFFSLSFEIFATPLLEISKSSSDQGLQAVYEKLEASDFNKASELIASKIIIEEGQPLGKLQAPHIPWRLAWGDLLYLQANFNKSLLIYDKIEKDIKDLKIDADLEPVYLRQLILHENLDNKTRLWETLKKLTAAQPSSILAAEPRLMGKVAGATALRLQNFLQPTHYQELALLSQAPSLTTSLWKSHVSIYSKKGQCLGLQELGEVLGNPPFHHDLVTLFTQELNSCLRNERGQNTQNALGLNPTLDELRLKEMELKLEGPRAQFGTQTPQAILDGMTLSLQLNLPEKAVAFAKKLPPSLTPQLQRRAHHLLFWTYHSLTRLHKTLQPEYEDLVSRMVSLDPVGSLEAQNCSIWISDLIWLGGNTHHKQALSWIPVCIKKTKKLTFLREEILNDIHSSSLQAASLVEDESLAQSFLKHVWQNNRQKERHAFFQKANLVSLDRLHRAQTRLRDAGQLEQAALLAARWAIQFRSENAESPNVLNKAWQDLAEVGAWFTLWEHASWVINNELKPLNTPETQFWLGMALENLGHPRLSTKHLWEASEQLDSKFFPIAAKKVLKLSQSFEMDDVFVRSVERFNQYADLDSVLTKGLAYPLGSDMWKLWSERTSRLKSKRLPLLRKHIINLKNPRDMKSSLDSLKVVCKELKNKDNACHQSIDLFLTYLKNRLFKNKILTSSFLRNANLRGQHVKALLSKSEWMHWVLGISFVEWTVLKDPEVPIQDDLRIQWNAAILSSLNEIQTGEWSSYVTRTVVKFPKEYWKHYKVNLNWQEGFTKLWMDELPQIIARDHILQHIITVWSLTGTGQLSQKEIENSQIIPQLSSRYISTGSNSTYIQFARLMSLALENNIEGFFKSLNGLSLENLHPDQTLFLRILKSSAELFWGLPHINQDYPTTLHSFNQPCLGPLFLSAMSFHKNHVQAAEFWLRSARELCPMDTFIETSFQTLFWAQNKTPHLVSQNHNVNVNGPGVNVLKPTWDLHQDCAKTWKNHIGENPVRTSLDGRVRFHLYHFCRFQKNLLEPTKELLTSPVLNVGSGLTHLLAKMALMMQGQDGDNVPKTTLSDKSALSQLVQAYGNSL